MNTKEMIQFEGVGPHILEARLRDAAKEIDRLRQSDAERVDLCDRLHQAIGEYAHGGEHYADAAAMLLRERDALSDNLTATQARCTELLDEARANRRIANAPPGELVALSHISHERRMQDAKWGSIEKHASVPDGTGDEAAAEVLAWTRAGVEEHQAKTGSPTCCWRHVVEEECAEVLAESDPKRLRGELVQLGACCVKWIEILDRRAVLQPTAPTAGLQLPGWQCFATRTVSDEETTRIVSCLAFNGAAKEWLTHCRACGAQGPEGP